MFQNDTSNYKPDIKILLSIVHRKDFISTITEAQTAFAGSPPDQLSWLKQGHLITPSHPEDE